MQFTPKKPHQNLHLQNLPHQSLSDAELLNLTLRAAKTEKSATLALLDYLVEVDSRRLYASVSGCSSLFDYLVKILGFSHPAASERVNTVRLMRAVPPVKEHLETGKLTLTSAAQIQRFVNTEQKVHPSGRAVSFEEKEKVVNACLGKSKREVEKTLFEKQSEPARVLLQEKIRPLSAERSEIKFAVSDATLEKLQELKNLIGNQALESIFDRALDALLLMEKKKRGVIKPEVIKSKVTKPEVMKSDLVKSTVIKAEVMKSAITKPEAIKPKDEMPQNLAANSTAAHGRPADDASLKAKINAEINAQAQTKPQTQAQLNSRFIPIDLKRFVFARSKGQCELIHPSTGQRCHSRFRLQIDHHLPLALGGKTEASNLRHLCFGHNLRMAAQAGLSKPAFATSH